MNRGQELDGQELDSQGESCCDHTPAVPHCPPYSKAGQA